jgi:argininosuccinate synthase
VRILLAYSGGLATSVAIPWLADEYGAEIVAVTVDLGQGRELTDVRERALAAGAVRAHVIDARDEFVRDFVLPSLQAGALYEGRYPLATALGRALIARRVVELARMEGAEAVAHGCTALGNDQVRLEVSMRAIEPGIRILAPAREWRMTPAQLADYARSHGIVAPVGSEGFSIDSTLWGRSTSGGLLADAWVEAPEEIFALTRAPADAPDQAAFIDLDFEAGVPVRANGIEMPALELIESLETIAGAHGVGRIDVIENRLVGVRSREVYEAPAAVVLHAAHDDLLRLVVARDLDRVRHALSRAYADLVYNGQWFSPFREALDAFHRSVQSRATGTVRLRLFKGDCRVVARRSPYSLEDSDAPSASDGFIAQWGRSVEASTRAWTGNRTPA